MLDEPTRTLARFAAGLTYEALPVSVRDYCKTILLDTVACALAGHQGEETAQVAAMTEALGGSGESSVIGGRQSSLAAATMLNGYLITAVTMCDIHRPTFTHISPEIVPPALLIAERDSLTGSELLVAIATGCEITTRIGLGLDPRAAQARGWHGPGVIGPFGAAASVGSLLRFDADTMARAFGLAGSQAAGTFAAWGTPTVKFHQCRAALSGLMAALLAGQGFNATQEFLTAHPGGLYNTYVEGGAPEQAVADLGERWELEKIALRLWPSGTALQGMNTAMFELIQKHSLAPVQVKKLRVSLSQPSFDLHGRFRTYKAKFEALLSAHYTAAIILHDGALSLEQFQSARYDDPAIRRFAAENVEVVADAALRDAQASVGAETVDGGRIQVSCAHPKGSPENPLSRAEVEDKFRCCARARLTEPQIDATLDAVTRIEKLRTVRTLMRALRRERAE